jgi:hypothetical protein
VGEIDHDPAHQIVMGTGEKNEMRQRNRSTSGVGLVVSIPMIGKDFFEILPEPLPEGGVGERTFNASQ